MTQVLKIDARNFKNGFYESNSEFLPDVLKNVTSALFIGNLFVWRSVIDERLIGLLFIESGHNIAKRATKENPCPDVFEYKQDHSTVIGWITLRSNNYPEGNDIVELKVEFSLAQYSVGNSFFKYKNLVCRNKVFYPVVYY